MNNRKEKLLADIRIAGMPTDADRKELESVLRNPVTQRALFAILAGSDAAIGAMVNQDFTTPQGVQVALKLQARAHCYSQIVDELLDFATTETQPEAPKPEETE